MAQRDNKTCVVCSSTFRSNDIRRATCGEKPCVKAYQEGPEKDLIRRHRQARSMARRPEKYPPSAQRWAAKIIASMPSMHDEFIQWFAATTIQERQEQFDPRLLEWAEQVVSTAKG